MLNLTNNQFNIFILGLFILILFRFFQFILDIYNLSYMGGHTSRSKIMNAVIIGGLSTLIFSYNYLNIYGVKTFDLVLFTFILINIVITGIHLILNSDWFFQLHKVLNVFLMILLGFVGSLAWLIIGIIPIIV